MLHEVITELEVSKEDFEAPLELTINVDCSSVDNTMSKEDVLEDLKDVIDF